MIGLLYGITCVFIILGWYLGGFALICRTKKKEGPPFNKKLSFLSLACLAIAWVALFVLYVTIQELLFETFWIASIVILSSLLFIVSGLECWKLAKIIRKKPANAKQEKRSVVAFSIVTTSLIVLTVMQYFIRFY